MEGGVTEEEMGFQEEIRGESERGMKENGFREGKSFFFFNLYSKTHGRKFEKKN